MGVQIGVGPIAPRKKSCKSLGKRSHKPVLSTSITW